jgi:hypothetical protein
MDALKNIEVHFAADTLSCYTHVQRLHQMTQVVEKCQYMECVHGAEDRV